MQIKLNMNVNHAIQLAILAFKLLKILALNGTYFFFFEKIFLIFFH